MPAVYKLVDDAITFARRQLVGVFDVRAVTVTTKLPMDSCL